MRKWTSAPSITKVEESPHEFPRDVIAEAIRQKDEVIPHLVSMIDDPQRLFDKCEQHSDYMGHMYALLLLAQFRVTTIYPFIFAICGFRGDVLNALGNEFIIKDLPRIIASVYGGDPAPIKAIIEDQVADEFLRETMLRALLALVIHGKMQRVELVEYCTFLVRERLERAPSYIWCGIASTCADLAVRDLLGDIRAAFAEDLVDQSCITMEGVEEDIGSGWEQNREWVASDPHYELVEDVVREMEWWACFNQREGRDRPPKLPSSGKDQKARIRPQPNPRPKIPPKIGRNQPCPCGSGKKYKKCCGNLARRTKGTNAALVRRLEIRDNLAVYHECSKCNRPAPGEDFDLMCPRCLRELDYEAKVREGKRSPANTRQSTLFGAGSHEEPRPSALIF